ncbi:MAG: hypothetical protein ABR599_01965 [Gemmatimonadota bacterium]
MLSAPPPEEPDAARELRARLFNDIDRLAFALEMEGVELVRSGRELAAARHQEMRLGVRLAQRLVAGIYASEVDERLETWAAAYEARLRGTAA